MLERKTQESHSNDYPIVKVDLDSPGYIDDVPYEKILLINCRK